MKGGVGQVGFSVLSTKKKKKKKEIPWAAPANNRQARGICVRFSAAYPGGWRLMVDAERPPLR
jgi:hypothetical protein